MGVLVCGGALMTCSAGITPATLTVLPANGILTIAPLACMTDIVPMVNIQPFGMCTSLLNPAVASATTAAMGVLTPMPCIPVTPIPWAPMLPTILLGAIPAITMDSKLICTNGGVINIIAPGQFSIVV